MDQICLCVADAQILSNKPELHASLWQNHPNRRKWNPDKFGTQTVIDQGILQWGKLTISGTCKRQDKIFSSLTLRINILAGEDCFFNYFFFFALNFFLTRWINKYDLIRMSTHSEYWQIWYKSNHCRFTKERNKNNELNMFWVDTSTFLDSGRQKTKFQYPSHIDRNGMSHIFCYIAFSLQTGKKKKQDWFYHVTW